MNFINRLKYSEKRIGSISIDVSKIYGGDDFNETFIVLSRLRNKIRKFKNVFVEKYIKMDDGLEQNHFCRTTSCFYRNGLDLKRILK